MAWHLAPSLVRLRSEINNKWPRRDKKSDGSIGDSRHSARYSDHNPNSRNSVNAIDIDKDGVVPSVIINAVKKHPAANYVIFNRTIWSRTHGWRARRYYGSNPHTEHIHVSIKQERSAENSTVPWGIGNAVTPKPKPVPSYPALVKTIKRGMRGGQVDDLQKRLKARGWKITVDGDFGAKTEAVVKAFQKDKHLIQDAQVGPVTWKALWTSKIT